MHNRINPFRGYHGVVAFISDAPVMPQPLTFEFAYSGAAEGACGESPVGPSNQQRSGHDPHDPDPAPTLSIGAMSC